MSYRIKPTQALAKERRRIALEQIDEAIKELDSGVVDTRDYIHDVRVRMKKLRALLRLYRTADKDFFQQENAWFRDLAQALAGPRDADVAVHTCNAILERSKVELEGFEFEDILSNLHKARRLEFNADASTSDLHRLRDLLCESRIRIDNGSVKKLKPNIVVNGFGMTYARGRKALKRSLRDPRPEAWHEWRKRVKYQRYQWELLRSLWPEMVNPRRHELHRLSDFLGENQDLNEFVRRIQGMDTQDTASKEKITALAKQRSEEVRRSALPLGRKLFAEKETCVKARVKTLFLIASGK